MLTRVVFLARKLTQTDFVRVFSLTAVTSLVKMLTAFISMKIVANILGPSGIALVGQLNNFATIIMAVASVGINQGVTKYISENKYTTKVLRKFIGTAFKLTFFSSIFCGFNLIVFHTYLSNQILNSNEFGYVFIIFGCSLVFYALNNLLISILNGLQLHRKYVELNVINSIVGFAFTSLLVYYWQLKGALISLISYQSVVFLLTILALRKQFWISFLSLKDKTEVIIIKKYLHYTLMTVTSAFTIPVSQLFIRSFVIKNISENDAGYLEGMNKLSAMYLMVVTSSLGVYFLPKLAELKSNDELRKEVFNAYKIIIPALIIGFLIVYSMRSVIVNVLFTTEFLPMSKLFYYQLIGDFFKIASWILAFLMVAKSMTFTFVLTEIGISFTLVFLSVYFAESRGILGVTQAYAINYFLYFILMLVIFRGLLFNTIISR